MSRAYPKSSMRRRKATGMRKRRKGDSRRMIKGDDARRMKKGIEMAKTAMSTTEVMLRVCMTRRELRSPVLTHDLSRFLFDTLSYGHLVETSPYLYCRELPSWRRRGMCCCQSGYLTSSVNFLTIDLGYFFESCRGGKNKVATTR